MATLPDQTSINTVLAHLPPHEAQRYIFRRLDFDTLKAARGVNKQWQALVDPMVDFHVTLSDHTKSNVVKFLRGRRVTTLSTTMFQGAYPREGIQLDVKSLQVIVKLLDDPAALLSARKGDINESCWRNVGISEQNLRKLLRDFKNVRKLHMASIAVKTFSNPQRSLSMLNLPNVNELVITFFDGGFHQLLPFMKNYFPSLKKVSIANVAMRRRERTTAYSWIFGFLARHFHLLEDVTLIFPEGIRNDEGNLWMLHEDGGLFHRRNRRRRRTSSLPLRDHKMPQLMYNLAKSKLEKLQLKRFIWDLSMMEGSSDRFDLGTTLLLSQIKLRELHLDNLRGPTDTIWEKLGTLLDNCSGTLVSFSIAGCFCSTLAVGNQNAFNCSWLKNCNELKSLEVIICGMPTENLEDLPKSINTLNLGHMLRQEQIEYLALNMRNLETWVLPQKGSLLNPFIPRISLYLFKVILHLPKLESMGVYTECADTQEILEYARTEEGIQLCHFMSITGPPREGAMTFHICREKFPREYGQLKSFIEENRPDPRVAIDDVNNNVIIEHFVRYLYLEGNVDHWIEPED